MVCYGYMLSHFDHLEPNAGLRNFNVAKETASSLQGLLLARNPFIYADS